MIRKTLIIAFCTLQAAYSFGQSKKINPPYVSKEFKYDSIVAYECKKGVKGWIIMNEKLYTKIITKEKKLPQPLVDSLTNFLWAVTKSEKNVTQACWYSHLGIIYYSSGKPVACFNISKECSAFYLYSKVNSSWPITELSFTESQRKKITWLCASLGFTYY